MLLILLGFFLSAQSSLWSTWRWWFGRERKDQTSRSNEGTSFDDWRGENRRTLLLILVVFFSHTEQTMATAAAWFSFFFFSSLPHSRSFFGIFRCCCITHSSMFFHSTQQRRSFSSRDDKQHTVLIHPRRHFGRAKRIFFVYAGENSLVLLCPSPCLILSGATLH